MLLIFNMLLIFFVGVGVCSMVVFSGLFVLNYDENVFIILVHKVSRHLDM